jgi:hypothetical protein
LSSALVLSMQQRTVRIFTNDKVHARQELFPVSFGFSRINAN